MRIRISKILFFIMFFLTLTSVTYAYGDMKYGQSQEREDYQLVSQEWDYKQKINFSDAWQGKTYWGGAHRIYSIRLDTKKLIDEGKIRSDCTDIRVASEGKLLGTRVQDSTCDTRDTWIYFSNTKTDSGYKMSRDNKVGNIEVFYGNRKAGLSDLRVSPYNRNLAANIRPESAIEMYYGSHGSSYTAHGPHKHTNDKDAPKQVWHVNFKDDHGNVGTDYIIIQDEDGNSVTRNSGDYYTIDSTNVPSWVQQGENITVSFHSNCGYHGGCEDTTSGQKSAQWGYPVQFNGPEPAEVTGTGEITTVDPELSITVEDPEGGGVDVTFYSEDGTQIGSTQAGVSDGGAASVEWTGLDQDETYRWYAEGCKEGNCQDSLTFQFTVNGFPQIRNIEFTNFTDSHGFEAEALIYDGNGDDDLQDCLVTVSGTDNSITREPGFDRSTGDPDTAYCSLDVHYDDVNVDRPLQSVDVEFAVSDSKNTDVSSASNSFPNNKPRVDNVEFTNYSDQHKFDTSVNFSDFDAVDTGEIVSCSLNFSDGEGNYVYKSMTPDYTVGDQGEVSCSYSNINASIPGFEVGEEITLNASANDRHGKTGWRTETHSIPNNVPYPTLIGPEDNGAVTGFPVNLKVRVNEEDVGDNVDVIFYNSTGNKLCERNSLSDGSVAECVWSKTNAPVKQYDWSVTLADQWNTRTPQDYSFEKVLGVSPRSNLGIDLNYSSIVMNAKSTRYAEITVENNVNKQKNLTLSLEGVPAQFLDQKTVKQLPEFDRNTQKTFTIRINSETPQTGNLTTKVQDNDLGVEATETIPVTVLENYRQTQRDVPGIGLVQILFLTVFSTVLYFVRL